MKVVGFHHQECFCSGLSAVLGAGMEITWKTSEKFVPLLVLACNCPFCEYSAIDFSLSVILLLSS